MHYYYSNFWSCESGPLMIFFCQRIHSLVSRFSQEHETVCTNTSLPDLFIHQVNSGLQVKVVVVEISLPGVPLLSPHLMAGRHVRLHARSWREALRVARQSCFCHFYDIGTSPILFFISAMWPMFGILAVLASVCFHHTSMGIHWGKTPNAIHLYTLLTWLRFHLVLVFVARNGPLQARVYGTWKDRLFQGFPSWI